MKLMFIDPAVEGTYSGSASNAEGVPQFINLDNVLWGKVFRGTRTLMLTLVNGGTWQLTYPDNKNFQDAAALIFRSGYEPEDN